MKGFPSVDEWMVYAGRVKRANESTSEEEDKSRTDVEVTEHAAIWMERRHIPLNKVLDVLFDEHVKNPGRFPGTYVYAPRDDKGPEVVATDEDCRSGGRKIKIRTVHDRQ